MFVTRTALLVSLALAVPAAAQPPAKKAEDPAVAALKRLGGAVTRDFKAPGNPVIAVRLFKDDVTDDDLKELAQFPYLRSLKISSKPLTGTGFAALTKLPLEDLDLGFSWAITGDGLKEIAKFQTLKVLHLCQGTFADADLPVLAALDNVEEFSLTSSHVKDVGTGKALAGMKKLRKLDVSNSRVGDGAMEKVAENNTELRELKLFGSAVTDAGYRYVGRMKNLEDLACSYDIRDTGLKELAGLSKLKKLSVWNSSVTVDAVAQSPLLKQLTDLGMGGSFVKPTAEQAERLRKLAPDCNISTR